jgi:pyruvate-formate lyase
MYPYYEMDIKNGKIKKEDVLELLELLRIKMTEIEYIASFSWEGLGSGNLFQNMILGGLTPKNGGAENELSNLVVQSAINCPTIQPTLSIWYHPQISNDFLLKSVECVKTGIGLIFFKF